MDDILKQLSAPFPDSAVQFKIQANPKKEGDKALVVAYIDARTVAARLNAVCGMAWSTSYTPAAIGNGIECSLTIGDTTRADVGMPSNTEPEKGGYSDAFKRAAVHYGIAAYLYDFPTIRVAVKQYGKSYYITREAEAELAQLVQLIHQGQEQLAAFKHITVSGYRPIEIPGETLGQWVDRKRQVENPNGSAPEPEPAAANVAPWVYTCDTCGIEVATAAAMRVSEKTGGLVLCKTDYTAWIAEQKELQGA